MAASRHEGGIVRDFVRFSPLQYRREVISSFEEHSHDQAAATIQTRGLSPRANALARASTLGGGILCRCFRNRHLTDRRGGNNCVRDEARGARWIRRGQIGQIGGSLVLSRYTNLAGPPPPR